MANRTNNRRFDWIAFLLLCVMILLAAWALAATEWTEYLNLIPLIGLVAVWAGAALGYSRFPTWFAVPTAAIYGFFITGWQLGGTLDPALPWRFRAEIVYGRIAVFVSKLIVGEPNEDSFIFVILMAVLFWVVGTWSAWKVFRRSAAWPAILSIGISLLAFTYFYYGVSRLGLFLGIFSLAALILASRMEITTRLQEWAAQRARVPLDVLSRVSITGLIAAILIIGLAWGGPAFAKSENLSEAWYTLTHPLESLRDGFDNAFNPIEGPTRVVPTEYGETLTLTAGTQPFDRLVMTVDPTSSR